MKEKIGKCEYEVKRRWKFFPWTFRLEDWARMADDVPADAIKSWMRSSQPRLRARIVKIFEKELVTRGGDGTHLRSVHMAAKVCACLEPEFWVNSGLVARQEPEISEKNIPMAEFCQMLQMASDAERNVARLNQSDEERRSEMQGRHRSHREYLEILLSLPAYCQVAFWQSLPRADKERAVGEINDFWSLRIIPLSDELKNAIADEGVEFISDCWENAYKLRRHRDYLIQGLLQLVFERNPPEAMLPFMQLVIFRWKEEHPLSAWRRASDVQACLREYRGARDPVNGTLGYSPERYDWKRGGELLMLMNQRWLEFRRAYLAFTEFPEDENGLPWQIGFALGQLGKGSEQRQAEMLRDGVLIECALDPRRNGVPMHCFLLMKAAEAGGEAVAAEAARLLQACYDESLDWDTHLFLDFLTKEALVNAPRVSELLGRCGQIAEREKYRYIDNRSAHKAFLDIFQAEVVGWFWEWHRKQN